MTDTIRQTGKISPEIINWFLATWEDSELLTLTSYDEESETWVVDMLGSKKKYTLTEMEAFLDGIALALIQVGKQLDG